MSDSAFSKGEWTSADGLTLHYRDYAGRDDRPPILCIPGLTRNARDFEPVAEAFGGEWRVIAPDLRGRGQSDYARDPSSYSPEHYVADLEALFEQAELGPVVAIGTSLGGIVAMLLAQRAPDRFAGVALNDIGPQVESAGLRRVREHVGQGGSFPTWMHAARALREQAGAAYPGYEISDWLRLSKRLMCVGGNGRIAFDYDMKIAEPFALTGAEAPGDMWAAYRFLAGRPVLVMRGELSDILSAETLARMGRELPEAEVVTIPATGHVPTLEEPEAQTAIARLLAKVA
ncbi:alpha/beta fold hydrolase [Altericroceibacterium xinjiangense]|uniref:alpha/beta fold hydrolase n=1 Tax=Altericroceibacterium xinjiangense TaxID=762261 RepID=UPI000F7E32A8|nr:alpha/beta hydrolase [Altericroceibacterium xinjiangense]